MATPRRTSAAASRTSRLRDVDVAAIADPIVNEPTNGGYEPPLTSDDVDDADQGDALSAVLAQFKAGDDFKLRVFRKRGRELVFAGAVDFDANALEAVQEKFGGGEYQGRVINADGVFVKGGTFTFTIDGAPVDPNAPRVVTSVAASATVGGSFEDLMKLGVMSMFESMQAANRATLEAMKQLATPPRETFSADKFIAIGGVVTPIILELIKGRTRNTLTAEDVAKIVAEKTGSRSSIAEIAKELRAMDELRDLFGDSGDGRRGGDDVVTNAVKTLGPVLLRAFVPGAAGDASGPHNVFDPSATHAVDVPPTSSTIAPMPPSALPSNEPLWAAQLADYIPLLVKIASAGEDPAAFAESTIRFYMAAESRGVLRELVAQDDAAQQVMARFPALASYPTWVTEFIDEARAILVGVDNADDGDDGAAG